MGIWAHPFEDKKKANRFRELMSKPWKVVKNNRGDRELPESFDLIGDDIFQDEISISMNIGEDARFYVYGFVNAWMRQLPMFNHVDREALTIVKDALDKFDDENRSYEAIKSKD